MKNARRIIELSIINQKLSVTQSTKSQYNDLTGFYIGTLSFPLLLSSLVPSLSSTNLRRKRCYTQKLPSIKPRL